MREEDYYHVTVTVHDLVRLLEQGCIDQQCFLGGLSRTELRSGDEWRRLFMLAEKEQHRRWKNARKRTYHR